MLTVDALKNIENNLEEIQKMIIWYLLNFLNSFGENVTIKIPRNFIKTEMTF